ncbi:MAG: tRNA preQ1(34) S-adenosylmethionine ribosyltransferase-isomerase QueA [Gammaproteobacteria bacterium RIFOXYB2_FULL_38_6]|nr:MAG: tRNA preQ1(34) S-adenosylmethionine ribosyltransferase-isomerase QueA [Gammaproteobacteria bacterium RIFOXYB2_FULL_38_6]
MRHFVTSDFDFHLPNYLIAQYPLKKRASSRLLVLNKKTGEVSHHVFTDILSFLNPNDLVVFNNTKVIPARLFGQKESGGRIECLIERIISEHEALAHIRASKSPKINSSLWLEEKIRAVIIKREGGLFHLRFEEKLLPALKRYGHMPLPPYIQRSAEQSDLDRYQTVYAKEEGAVAAPTAGLHFDETLLKQIQQKCACADVTLHVGSGTFQPVRTEKLSEHVMHHEYVEVPKETCEAVKRCKKRGGRVVAVGTTVVRSLETAAKSGDVQPFFGDTNLFIQPGFEFKMVDALLTNFHLPCSTLLMLVCAFGGYEFVMHAYEEAVKQHYRFFSYGDAMLVR